MDVTGLLLVIALVLDALITLACTALLNSRNPDDQPNARRLQLTQQVMATLLRGIVVTLAFTLLEPFPALLAFAFLGVLVVFIVVQDVVVTATGQALAQTLAPILRPFFAALSFVLSPIVVVIVALYEFVRGALGRSEDENSMTEEELLNLIDNDDNFEDDERRMIQSILQLDQTTAREVMTPRIDINAVSIDTSIADARSVFLTSGHSRMPVFEDSIDNVKGLVYVKDLLEVWHNGHTTVKSVAEILRSAFFVPEDMPADVLLRDLQKQQVHLAIVVDKYGGTAGLVTIENILEEIVGDIRDEYDQDEEIEFVQLGPAEFTVSAGIDLDDFNNRLGVEIETEDSDTLGGYIFTQLGRVPEPGEVLQTQEISMRVDAVEGRRIRQVTVTRRDLDEAEPKPADGTAVEIDNDAGDTIDEDETENESVQA